MTRSPFPTADAGHAATLAAERNDGALEGRIGAGAGATVAKMGGPDQAKPGGIGSAARRLADGSTVGALVVNNALGDVHARDGRPLTASTGSAQPPVGNTTLVVIGTDANLDRAQCRKLAELGHDALAIGIRPTHTLFDGDVVFTMSTGDGSRLSLEAFTALGDGGRRCGGRGDRAKRRARRFHPVNVSAKKSALDSPS